MPLYDYRCENGHTFEVMQRMSDDPLTVCQVCRAPVQRVLHAPAVHFKGSGFYTTDYGRKKRVGGSDGSDSAPSKDSGKSESGKGDSGKSDSGKSDSKSSSDGSSKKAETKSSSSSSAS